MRCLPAGLSVQWLRKGGSAYWFEIGFCKDNIKKSIPNELRLYLSISYVKLLDYGGNNA